MSKDVFNCTYDMYLIDHGNDEYPQVSELLLHTAKNVYSINYNKKYLQTLKDLVDSRPIKEEDYVWVCSSICDYTDFDFSYVYDCSSFDHTVCSFYNHSGELGDTFFVNVAKLRDLIPNLEHLNSLYVTSPWGVRLEKSPKRFPTPVFIVSEDTHTEFMKYEHKFPYALYITSDNKNIDNSENEKFNLWESHKNIISTSSGSTHLLIPKEAASYVKKELYDYPYIYTHKNTINSNPLDIVFLSNGEICAEENYEYLLNVTKGISNRIVRVDGVNGRANAYHAGVTASNTPWAFMVFAKLKVNAEFDWNWQPDRLQVPKHYIFYATNPVNGLEYGHQAMIAYNKKIVLANPGVGLDFTLDSEIAVIPTNSGIATFNTDAFTTWRTAFREAIKLRNDTHNDSKERLNIWLTVGNGDFGEYSIKGANDAVSYYEEVNGEFEKLKLSYEWEWLKNRFNK